MGHGRWGMAQDYGGHLVYHYGGKPNKDPPARAPNRRAGREPRQRAPAPSVLLRSGHFLMAAQTFLRPTMSAVAMQDLLEGLRDRWARKTDSENEVLHNEEATRFAGQYKELLDAGANETEIHGFLKEHPFLLMYGVMGGVTAIERLAIFSKLRLGDEYVTDFALVSADSDGARWTFIELEGPQDPLFTKGGDRSSALSHGLRQIDDWSRLLKQDPAYAKRRLGDVHKSAKIRGPRYILRMPTFLVVIGRESFLTNETRARKAEMNDGDPRKQIATYDRLYPLRWLRSRPLGVLDDAFERGEGGRPRWPQDEDGDWNDAPADRGDGW